MGNADRQSDEQLMQRAIALAGQGRGAVEPNPMVGCVIVKGGQIVGEGYHQKFGEAHAEPNAIAACAGSAAGATAYVTLEPCCHLNKKTPPCVPVLIAAKLARVVIGCLDPNPAVNGRGVAALREAGIEVIAPVLDGESRQLIAPFLAGVVYRRPYVTLKWAQTADGKVAGPKGKRVQISNASAMRAIHELRARCDAILVGINTVLNDDPMLTARNVPQSRRLLRVVLDRELRLGMDSQLVRTAGEHPLRIYCGEKATETKAADLKECGVEVKQIAVDAGGRMPLRSILRDLNSDGVTNLLVESGPTLARGFMSAGLADRVWITRSATTINDDSAPAAATVEYPPAASVDLDGDVLTEYLNPFGEVFFAMAPSADLAMAAKKA